MEPGVTYSPTPAPQDPPVSERGSNPQGLPVVPLILGGGVIIVMVILAGRVLLHRPTSTSAVTPTPSVDATNPTAAVTPQPQVRSGWKLYEDTIDAFSIQCPQEYKLKPYQESSFRGVELAWSQPASNASSSANISLKIIYLQNTAKNAQQFAKDQSKLESTPIITNGTFFGLPDFELGLKGEWGRGKILFFETDSVVYRISYVIAAPLNLVPSYENTISQILSSFDISNLSTRGK